MATSIDLLRVVALIIPGIAILMQFYYSDIMRSEELGKITLQGSIFEVDRGYLLLLLSLLSFISAGIFFLIASSISQHSWLLHAVGGGGILLGFAFLFGGMMIPILGQDLQDLLKDQLNLLLRSSISGIAIALILLVMVSITAAVDVWIIELPLELIGEIYGVLILFLAGLAGYYISSRKNLQ